jgi:phage FluMu protein Com
MPIRFRCGHCNRLLGIARRKAGTDAICPHCGYTITVPEPRGERTELAEIESLLHPHIPEPPPPPAPPATAPPPLPSSATEGDGARPLFEQDMDEVLGGLNPPPSPHDDRERKPPPTSGTEALSLDPERGQWVLSSQQVTLAAVGVFVLVILAFVAGFLIGTAR